MKTPRNVADWLDADPTMFVILMSESTSLGSGCGDACGVVRMICVPSALTLWTVAGSVVPTGAAMMNSTVTGCVK